MGLVFILFTVLFCVTIYRLAKKLPRWCRLYRLIEKLPGPPCDNILLGHTSVMSHTPEETPKWSFETYKRYGGIYRLWFAWHPVVLVADANHAEVFFTDKNLQSKSVGYDTLHVWLGLGLLTSQGQLWQQRRKLITPAFHFSILNDFCDVFVNNALKLVEKLDRCTDEVDVYALMHYVSLDNICETAMGIQINALTNPRGDYIQAIEDVAHAIVKRTRKPWLSNDFIYFSTPRGRKQKRDLDIIFELSNKVIGDKKKEKALKKAEKINAKIDEFAVPGKKKLAFLDLLLEASESQSLPLSDKDLRDEVNTFMFEGHDTTAASMSFTLYLLGLHPEIQEKCYKELDGIFQGSNRRPTVDDLRKMNYLEQVIKESLRLFPSVPAISRKVGEDTTVGNYIIPEGTTFLLNVYNLHRDEKYFPDPEKFDPGRFTPDNCALRHPFAYIPFAAGPRNCIGQKFAMMEEKVILSYVLRNFTLESVYGRDDLQILFSLVIRSQKSLSVQFRSRNVQQSID